MTIPSRCSTLLAYISHIPDSDLDSEALQLMKKGRQAAFHDFALKDRLRFRLLPYSVIRRDLGCNAIRLMLSTATGERCNA